MSFPICKRCDVHVAIASKDDQRIQAFHVQDVVYSRPCAVVVL